MCDWLTLARSCGLINDHVAENENHVAEIDVSWLILYLMNYRVDQQVDRVVNMAIVGLAWHIVLIY